MIPSTVRAIAAAPFASLSKLLLPVQYALLSWLPIPSFLRRLPSVRGLAACKLGILLPAAVGVVALAEQFRLPSLNSAGTESASNLQC